MVKLLHTTKNSKINIFTMAFGPEPISAMTLNETWFEFDRQTGFILFQIDEGYSLSDSIEVHGDKKI